MYVAKVMFNLAYTGHLIHEICFSNPPSSTIETKPSATCMGTALSARRCQQNTMMFSESFYNIIRFK